MRTAITWSRNAGRISPTQRRHIVNSGTRSKNVKARSATHCTPSTHKQREAISDLQAQVDRAIEAFHEHCTWAFDLAQASSGYADEYFETLFSLKQLAHLARHWKIAGHSETRLRATLRELQGYSHYTKADEQPLEVWVVAEDMRSLYPVLQKLKEEIASHQLGAQSRRPA